MREMGKRTAERTPFKNWKWEEGKSGIVDGEHLHPLSDRLNVDKDLRKKTWSCLCI